VISLVLTLAGLAVILLVVVGARLWDGGSWRRSLIAYELQLPNVIEPTEITDWLSSLAALTHAPRFALLPQPPVVFEVLATAAGVRFFVHMPSDMRGALLASFRSALPSVRLRECEAVGLPLGRCSQAAEVHLAGRLRQLAVDRQQLTSRSMLAALQPLGGEASIRWQWIVTGAGTPEPLEQPDRDQSVPWWLEAHAPSDADELRAARLKQRLPMLHATGRLIVQADTRAAVNGLFGRSWGAIRLLNTPGARLVRSWWPAVVVRARADGYWLPVLWWPLRLNSAELGGLLALPLGESPLPGLPLGLTRQVPPPIELPSVGTVLADATYPGIDRPLALATADRLMHVACLGPTGTGKSTLMMNMALQDVERGDGLAVLDPKADMAADLLRRLPDKRWDDVIIVNPSDTDCPVGFNVLASDGSEAGRELAVDHVLHVFHEHWKEFWGPRTDAILRAGLLVLANAKAPNGAAFTVCELPALLTDVAFRRYATEQPTVPAAVHEFWRWFDGLSAAERTQVVGPVLNKLTALTQRTPLRLLLGQSDGLDLRAVIRDRKVLVMPLSRGLVGAETAALLSSLMMSSLWQAALNRVRVPAAQRHPYWLFVDEAAEVVRLPLDLADVMAEARGLGVGLTLAMQHLSQLPAPVRNAMLATVRSQVVFQLEPADARALAKSFAPTLSEDDLTNLPAHEVALRLSVGGRTSRPTTGLTRPLPEPTSDSGELRARSRTHYGRPRHEVEAGLAARLQVPRASAEYGRRPRASGGRS
jgi:hypothetical protein